MRVIHLIPTLGGAGAERIALQLGDGMQAHGLDVVMVALYGPCHNEIAEFPELRRIHLLPESSALRWPMPLPSLVVRLRKVLRRKKPDWVLVHSPEASIVLGLSGMSAKAIVVHHHRDSCWPPNRSLRARASYRMRCWVARRFQYRMVGVSQWVAEEAAAVLGSARARPHWIHNGVDTASFAAQERNLSRPPVVCVIGRLVAFKRPQLALRAFIKFHRERPDAQLWFVGDGSLRAPLEAEAAASTAVDAVHFFGYRTDVPKLMAQAHLLWQPSAGEGFGLVTAEAMAAGLPVVGMDAVGTREIVISGATGILVDSADCDGMAAASLRLLANPAQYRAFAIAGRRRVEEHFSVDSMIEGYLQLLRGETTPQRRSAVGEP